MLESGDLAVRRRLAGLVRPTRKYLDMPTLRIARGSSRPVEGTASVEWSMMMSASRPRAHARANSKPCLHTDTGVVVVENKLLHKGSPFAAPATGQGHLL